jgi:hypothetical protein
MGNDGMSDVERGRQAYTAWFTVYPDTHERAGQTVEVVTRDVYEALARQHARAVADNERMRHALRVLLENTTGGQ